MGMKRCSKCKANKQLSEFYNMKSGAFGKMGSCKVCHRAYVLANRDREAYNTYQREYMRTYDPKK